MALNLGAISLTALYLGSTAISTAYLGSVQVYDAGGAFTPASLFASGEEGAWYEPSPTTCFTDTAGTIAATYGDAVARINDLSGNGNHATQSSEPARPILARVPPRGRVNELSETDALATQSVTVTAAQRTLSFTGTGTVTLTGASTAGPLVGTGAGDRVSLTFTPSAGTLTLTVLGTVTDAQLELGASATTYQFVADSLGYDITEAGVTSLEYLAFDGSDDGMLVSGMSAAAGPVTLAVAFDVSADSTLDYIIDIETGRLILAARTTATGNSGVYNGTAWISTPTSLSTPYVMTGLMRTAGSLRLNGSESATFAMTERAIGGAVRIGSVYENTGAFLNGNLFGLIVRAADTTGADLSNTEAYLAAKAGVTL